MISKKRPSDFALISLFISLLGLSFVPLFLLSSPPVIIPWQTRLIGSAFSIICILGIIAAVSPAHCTCSSKPVKSQQKDKIDFVNEKPYSSDMQKEGHHPTCGRYLDHVIRIKHRILCAGCTGLAIGAVIALFGSILFFFFQFHFILIGFTFWLGWGFVLIGLLQHFFYRVIRIHHGIIRLFLNVLFVVGSFFLLASLMQLTNNFILGVYLLVLIIYWIFTRIVLSRRSHRRICMFCEIPDCPHSKA